MQFKLSCVTFSYSLHAHHEISAYANSHSLSLSFVFLLRTLTQCTCKLAHAYMHTLSISLMHLMEPFNQCTLLFASPSQQREGSNNFFLEFSFYDKGLLDVMFITRIMATHLWQLHKIRHSFFRHLYCKPFISSSNRIAFRNLITLI